MKKKNIEISDSLEGLFNQIDSKIKPKKLDLKEETHEFSQNMKKAVHSNEKNEILENEMIDLANHIEDNKNRNRLNLENSNEKILSSDLISSNGFIQCPPAIKKIPITRKAFEEIIMVAQAINEISQERWGNDSEKLEVYMYILADPGEIKPDKPATISSIYIPYHEASEAAVNVSEEGILDVKNYLKKTNKILLGWAHSHGHYEAYSSSTDEINHQILLNETSNILTLQNFQLKYIYGITVVESGDRYGVILTQYPCSHVQHEVDEEFDIKGVGYQEFEKREIYLKIKALLEERANVIKPSQKTSIEDNVKDLTEELLAEFLHNLLKSKNILYDDVSEEEDKHFDMLQKILQKYDNLLLANVEQSFTEISTRLLKILNKFKANL